MCILYDSEKQQEGESEWEMRERREVRSIWLTGQKGLTGR